MTGRQKILGALSPQGSRELPVVICYPSVFIRDHWKELTSLPWWYLHETDIERQWEWRREVLPKLDLDWYSPPGFLPQAERQRYHIEEHGAGVYRLDAATGQKLKLTRPQVGGWIPGTGIHSVRPQSMARTKEDIALRIPDPVVEAPDDLAIRLQEEYGSGTFALCHEIAPLWYCYNIWGFEGLMAMVADQPDLVRFACERRLAVAIEKLRRSAALGTDGVWIEDCLTDQISPAAFKSLNLPFLQRLIEAAHKIGLKSIYYFCGNPAGKWDLILSTGSLALSLEESKKGFKIDIEVLSGKSRGRCGFLGNLDSINLLPGATETELSRELARQIKAGRENRCRFIMSTGSPVTPGTSLKRLNTYLRLARKYSQNLIASRRVADNLLY